MNRTGQTWEEHNVVFVVTGPPIPCEWYDRHPVCFLVGPDRVMSEEKYMDEGTIPWENFPYMTRLG